MVIMGEDILFVWCVVFIMVYGFCVNGVDDVLVVELVSGFCDYIRISYGGRVK